MTDVAHNAPGPASPKPGDVALKQAGRANAPDKGKLRVFISYSRDDAGFADQLEAALDACGFETSIDRHGVSGGEEWKSRLGNLISEADTVVFVLTPTSASSPICSWEVGEAVRLGKRILPANWRPLEGASPPPQLRERNYICFYDNPKEPGSGFGTGLAKLVAALNTDFDWLREHTRYLQRATEWDRGGRPANRLLSGDDIAEAKAWAARRPKNAPEPTALHLDFIRASEEEAQARSNAQRKQLEAMAAAQDERAAALKEAEDALRKRATIRNAALVVVSMFAVLAGWLWVRADQARIRAVEAQKVAEEQKEQADHILGSATTIILNLEDKMDIATQKEVFVVYQTGANRGHEGLMVNLGNLYAKGFGVAKDYSKAREWYQKAADKELWAGTVSLARLYRDGLGVPQDYAKARELYEKAADKDGSGETMATLGIMYLNGHGVARDYAKAREWLEKAADKGSRTAMHSLGLLYEYGLGVAKDYAKAREWYENAAAKGNAEAMLQLGMLYYGGEGVAKDYAKAHEWYENAAAKGNAEAMLKLGMLYYAGEGVAKDYAKAREWCQKAADKGDANAMTLLGAFYYDGVGVAKDYAKAREWLEKAADKGSRTAMHSLGLLYEYGLGVAQDYVKARELYEKAAEEGIAMAMTRLGLLYTLGHGVAQDYAKAREWYEKAAGKGNPEAETRLEKLSIEEAANAGRYPEALQLQEALAAKVEAAETTREGKPGKETAYALKSVAWRALFAREFTKALTAADRAHALLPDDLGIETNRAHALMFVKGGEDCKELYLAYKGKPFSEQDTRLWEQVIVEDFAEFRRTGLTHPMMADVETELDISR